MTQSKLGSLYEALLNVLVGFSVNYCFNIVIIDWIMGKHISLLENLYIGLMFTGVSVARSYIIRRWFNNRLHSLSQRMAGEQA
jgi:ABC-type bacteriocin/lantibiotic exporter with double-glycine peptidase domain